MPKRGNIPLIDIDFYLIITQLISFCQRLHVNLSEFTKNSTLVVC